MYFLCEADASLGLVIRIGPRISLSQVFTSIFVFHFPCVCYHCFLLSFVAYHRSSFRVTSASFLLVLWDQLHVRRSHGELPTAIARAGEVSPCHIYTTLHHSCRMRLQHLRDIRDAVNGGLGRCEKRMGSTVLHSALGRHVLTTSGPVGFAVSKAGRWYWVR